MDIKTTDQGFQGVGIRMREDPKPIDLEQRISSLEEASFSIDINLEKRLEILEDIVFSMEKKIDSLENAVWCFGNE